MLSHLLSCEVDLIRSVGVMCTAAGQAVAHAAATDAAFAVVGDCLVSHRRLPELCDLWSASRRPFGTSLRNTVSKGQGSKMGLFFVSVRLCRGTSE